MNGQTKEYPLCDRPIKEFEQSRELGKQNNDQLKKMFKGFGDKINLEI